jgi:hypothetical protein
MKRREVDHYLTVKLKYAKKECRHIHFLPHLDGHDVPLPSIIALPRSSAEVRNNVLGDIARNLGLREMDLRISIRCEISAACVYICQAGMCVDRCSRQLVADPNVYKENVMAMKTSIARLLHTAERLVTSANGWNKHEEAALYAMVARLDSNHLSPELRPMLGDLKVAIRKFSVGA